jgi:hypothetical protein
MFPEGFRPTNNPEDLLVPDFDKQKSSGSFSDKFKKMFAK